MPAIMEISVTPLGKSQVGLGDAIVEVLKVAERHGVNYEISPMATTMEGDLSTLLRIAGEMHEVCFGLGYLRVQTAIRIDDRRDKESSMRDKVDSVRTKLAQQALHIRES